MKKYQKIPRMVYADNPKRCLWTSVSCLAITLFTTGGKIWYCKYKNKYEAEAYKKRVEHKANMEIRVARAKAGIRTNAETMGSEKPQASDSSCYSNVQTQKADLNLQGHTTEELIACSNTDADKWIVDGYMNAGLVNLLVAGGGVGKSILMVQIAIAVANGSRPEFLPDACSASNKQAVVYYRLEDFSDEIKGKYGKGKVLKQGIKWFLPQDLKEFSLEGFLEHLKSLAETLKENTLVCIDPATKLTGYRHAEFIRGAEEAMAIAKKRSVILTLVAAIHLDEIKDWTPLSSCDIKGGDLGLQQAGSVTALRRERTNVNSFRYLQCLKEPKGYPKPFSGKVLVCEVVEGKIDSNNKYLHYKFNSTKPESEALPKRPKSQQESKGDSPSPRKASNQKITPECERIILDDYKKSMKPEEIRSDLLKRAKISVSNKTIRRYIQRMNK